MPHLASTCAYVLCRAASSQHSPLPVGLCVCQHALRTGVDPGHVDTHVDTHTLFKGFSDSFDDGFSTPGPRSRHKLSVARRPPTRPGNFVGMKSLRCRLPGAVGQVGPDDRQSNYPGDMSSMPARSAHRAVQPWATIQINPAATSVPCFCPASTTLVSSSVPGTQDSTSSIFLFLRSSLESGSWSRRRGGLLI